MDGGTWRATVHGVAKSQTRLSNFTFTFHFHALEKEMTTTPVFLPGESQGQGSLVGCRLWGRTELDTTEVTQQQQQLLAGGLNSSPCGQLHKLPEYLHGTAVDLPQSQGPKRE